jgi:hypothetical protein
MTWQAGSRCKPAREDPRSNNTSNDAHLREARQEYDEPEKEELAGVVLEVDHEVGDDGKDHGLQRE